MNFQALITVMYQIATMTLSRVSLKENRGVVGLVVQQDTVARTVQVHWGYDNGKAILSWHGVKDVIPIPSFSKEMNNGH